MARFMPFNEIGIGGRFDCNGLLDQPIEQHSPAGGQTSVESKCELIKVVVEMVPRCSSLVDAQQPALEQRGDTVKVRKDVGSRGGFVNVSVWLEGIGIGRKSIGYYGRAWGH